MFRKLLVAIALALVLITVWRFLQPSPPKVVGRSQASDAPQERAPTVLESPGERAPAPRTPPAGTLTDAGPPAEARPDDSMATGGLVVRVSWSDGAPAEGVRLALRLGSSGLPRMGLEELVTDAHGEARAEGLPVGSDPVQVATDRGAGALVRLLAGEVVEVEIELPAGVDVGGWVQHGRGVPVPNAAIWLTTGHTDWLGGHVVAYCDGAGRFLLRDVPADQSIGAIAEGFAPSPLVDLDLVDASQAPVEVRLELTRRGGALEGRVSGPGGEPLPGAQVAVGESPLFFQGRVGPGQEETWTPRAVSSGADGRFRVGGLEPGTREVAVRSAGLPVWTGKVEVSAGVTTPLEVQLVEGVTIKGVVSDARGATVEGALVRAFEAAVDPLFLQQGQFDHTSAFGYPTGVSGPDGRYELRAAAAGTVHLYANPPRVRFPGRIGAGAQERDEEVLEASPGTVVEWNPVLEAGPTIAGRVTYLDGEPMPDVFVSALDEESGVQQALSSDDGGRFRFLRLRVVPHTLSVQLWGAPEGAAPVQVEHVWPDSGEVHLVADYPAPTEQPSGSVRGRVDDAGERGAEGAALSVLLASDKHWWYSPVPVEERGFALGDVKPGRYRPVVLVGDAPVLHGEWFELAPGEERDLGTLVTQEPGSLVVRLVRDEGTFEVEPTLYLTTEVGAHGREVELGRDVERRIDNLSAGTYSVTLRGEGLATERSSVTVEVGLRATLELRLRAGVLCSFEIAYPEQHSLGTLHLRIVGEDGEEVAEFEDSRPALFGRPYSQLLTVPLGRFTLTAESQSGLAGSVEFEVCADGPVQPSVRLELR